MTLTYLTMTAWSIPGTTNADSSHSIFFYFLHEQGLFQLNHHPNRINNILDLVITSASDCISNLMVNPHFNTGVHDSVSFSLYISRQPNISNVPNTVICDFCPAEFVTVKRVFQLINWNQST